MIKKEKWSSLASSSMGHSPAFSFTTFWKKQNFCRSRAQVWCSIINSSNTKVAIPISRQITSFCFTQIQPIVMTSSMIKETLTINLKSSPRMSRSTPTFLRRTLKVLQSIFARSVRVNRCKWWICTQTKSRQRFSVQKRRKVIQSTNQSLTNWKSYRAQNFRKTWTNGWRMDLSRLFKLKVRVKTTPQNRNLWFLTKVWLRYAKKKPLQR